MNNIKSPWPRACTSVHSSFSEHGNGHSVSVQTARNGTETSPFFYCYCMSGTSCNKVILNTHSFSPLATCTLFSITILGTGAKWLSALEDRQVYPMDTHRLHTLHTILSTGSPLKPQSYDYVYSKIKEDVLLGSITGQCTCTCTCT